MRKNCLYERSLGKWVQYEEGAYLELRRLRTRTCMRMRRQKRCMCPKNEQWRCDGNCDGCTYLKNLEVSFNSKVSESEELTLGDVLTDGIDQESACVEKIYCEEMLKRLDEIMPMAREIGELRLQGKSDREIARELGIDRMTMVRMLGRAKEVLLQEFQEK